MTVRGVTLIVCALDLVGWLLTLIGYLGFQTDQTTAGMDYVALVFVSALLVLTAVPALVLALIGRSPKTALALALAFPAILAIVFVAAISALAQGRPAVAPGRIITKLH
jgi:predicted permease